MTSDSRWTSRAEMRCRQRANQAENAVHVPRLFGLCKTIGLIAVATPLILLATLLAWARLEASKAVSPLDHGEMFVEQHLGVTYEVFDVGVADVNSDNFLDIYTVNHNVRQSLLINDGEARFKDRLLEMGLSQHAAYPGFEPIGAAPEVDLPGLYIYWHDSTLVLRTHDVGKFGAVTGELFVPRATSFTTTGGCRIETTERRHDLAASFEFVDDGQVTLLSYHYLFSVDLRLDTHFPKERVYIGANRLPPTSHDFTVNVGRDRHGMAWADYNGDGKTDVFVVRGGGLGKMERDPVNNNDELLIQEEDGFEDRAATAGIVKDVAPGRRVALVDYDTDGLLDIYVVCGRGTPPRQWHPNQLHRQDPAGQFVNVASQIGLDNPEKGAFVWLDVESDGDMDLFWTNDTSLWLYTNQAGHFQGQEIGPHTGNVQYLSVADYDCDRDLDVFVASEMGSILLNNLAGEGFRVADLGALGIPSQSYAAQWVDYDNDGLTDLFMAPQGIYRQLPDGHFEATNLLARHYARGRVYSTWFDANNDGARDLMIAVKELPSPQERVSLRLTRLLNDGQILPYEKWNLMLYRNTATKNHWLQFRLIGSAGNRPAIGAIVEVTTPSGTQTQQVGQADGALRSQGHYRLYFGLGAHHADIKATIYWPDGQVHELDDLTGDQLIVVSQDDCPSRDDGVPPGSLIAKMAPAEVGHTPRFGNGRWWEQQSDRELLLPRKR